MLEANRPTAHPPNRPRAALLLIAILVTACSEAPRDGDVATDTGEFKTLGGGPPGGTLVVLADREPDQLNPLTFNSNPAYHAVHLMFRALAARDSTLSGYAPDLAKSWRLEGDSLLAIELKNDVFWHDGRRVTAEDVVFTIERQGDEQTASPRRSDVGSVQSATARDSFTVDVRMKRTGLYAVNALLEVVPVPKHLLDSI